MIEADPSTAPDLGQAAAVVDQADAVVARGVGRLVGAGGPEKAQVLAYDLAHSAAALATARSMLDYGARGDAFVAAVGRRAAASGPQGE